MSEKLPNNLSLEELLNITETEQEVKTNTSISKETNLPETLSFLLVFKIGSGKYRIPSRMLYFLYKKWAKVPVSYLAFTEQCKNYLLIEKAKQGFWYLINFEESLLTKQVLESIPEKRTLTDSIYLQQHFEYFLKYINVKSGTFPIEGFVLYELYNEWCNKSRSKRSLTYPLFLKFCRLYLPNERITENRTNWFCISKKEIELFESKEILDRLRNNYYEKEKDKKQKTRENKRKAKTKQKNDGKISRSTTKV